MSRGVDAAEPGVTGGTLAHRVGSLRAMKLSARNQLPATVTGVNKGAAIANVELDVNGQRLVASITVEAADQLGIAEGKSVTAVIKASDVILATDD
jgi:molybdopterin-binding protein